MRITFGMNAQSSLRNIEANSQRMADLEGQLTSGSKINKPSDDPVGAARALNFQQSIDQSNQYLKNIDQSTNWLNTTDSTLGSVNDAIQRARELAVQAANGTNSSEDEAAIASEVTQIQQSVLDLSNTKLGSSYIFSGTKSDKPGYLQATSSAINPSVYQGNTASVQRVVSPGVSIGVNASAQSTFDPVFSALATLQAGLASVKTAPAVSTSAIAMGNAAAAPITTGGTLTINGIGVTLAAGDTAAQTVGKINATTGLQGANGVTASLSTAPGPVGNLVLTANSVGSGGVIAIGPPTGATNTIFADLGLSAVTTAGADNATDIKAKLQASLTALDGALDAVNLSRSTIGARENRLTTLQTQQTSVNTNLTGLLTQVKDVDMAQAITAYTSAQTVYTASLKSAAQAIQPSLLDYLGGAS